MTQRQDGAHQDCVDRVEVFFLRMPREVGLHMGRRPEVNERGYIIDPDNGTIYPADDRTLIVKITTRDGRIGWGETYGIAAAGAVKAIIADIIAPVLRGRDPLDAGVIWQDFYNMMRVRGYTGGFYVDALAAIDIALWDLAGKILGQPVAKLLGGRRRDRIPAYVTNIAGSTIEARIASVQAMWDKGFRAFKVHASASFDYIDLVRQLRERFGADIQLMVDLHWNHTSAEALTICRKLEAYNLLFLEAPCRYEDIDGLARVARSSSIAIAGGEEWRTLYDAQARLQAEAVTVIQPEMGRSGITQFMKMATLAEAHHARVMPHATIGFGIFMAASLQASAAIEDLPLHEYQNTVLPRHLPHFDTTMVCDNGFYNVPDAPGLGIEPRDSLWQFVVEP